MPLVLALLLLASPGLFLISEEELSLHEVEHGPERWACPMLCVVLEFGGLCPVCGMDLEEIGISTGAVTVGAVERELIGLTLVRVESLKLQTRLRLPGTVTAAETSRAVVTAWTTGRIDRFPAPATGERLESGATVAWIYSSELIEAQNDLLYALRSEDSVLVRGARHRLGQLGVPRWIMADIAESGSVMESLPVVSRFAGTVTGRQVESGDWVRSGQVLLEVANLSDVWIETPLLEGQTGLLMPGDTVMVLSSRGEPVTATVTHKDPFFEPSSRTVTARLVAEAPSVPLLPGELVQVIISSEVGGSAEPDLGVPASSVLSLGTRHIVYVLSSDSAGAPPPSRIPSPSLGVRLEPREVLVGPMSYSTGGERYYPVLSGLSQGEIVAAQGAFLLDSQAELTGLPSLMIQPEPETR